MRADIITRLKALSSATLGTFTVTEELPWSSDDTPLYIKNLKRIYVGPTQTDLDPIFDTLDGSEFATEVATTTVYYASDAKQLPANHATLTEAIRNFRINFDQDNWSQRRVTATTDFEGDRMVQSLEFVFERTVNN
jgi:hypothetical protein